MNDEYREFCKRLEAALIADGFKWTPVTVTQAEVYPVTVKVVA